MEKENSKLPVLSPNDASTLLQIKESTLRKYSLLLEDVGYTFQRNNQNQRWYSDSDIVAFKKLISLKNNTDMTLKDCAEAVLLWSKGQTVTQPSTVVHNDTTQQNDDITELKEMINQQNIMLREFVKKIDEQENFNRELVQRMDQQQKLLNEPNEQEKARLEHHDKLLMESIRESQESKKMFLEIKNQLSQIAAAQEEEKKKPWYKKLFNK